MVGSTKFYVKKNEPVNIKPPLVVKTDLSYNFKAWDLNTEDEANKVSFDDDRTIEEAPEEKPDLELRNPRPGINFIDIRDLTDGATGHLIIIQGSNEYEFINVERSRTVRQGRRLKQETIKGFDLTTQGVVLQAGDRIKYYATKGDLKSEERELIIR